MHDLSSISHGTNNLPLRNCKQNWFKTLWGNQSKREFRRIVELSLFWISASLIIWRRYFLVDVYKLFKSFFCFLKKKGHLIASLLRDIDCYISKKLSETLLFQYFSLHVYFEGNFADSANKLNYMTSWWRQTTSFRESS